MEYKQKISWMKLMLVRDGGRDNITRYRITSSKDIYNLAINTLQAYFGGHDREEFVIIGLDGKNKMQFIHSVSVGCLTSSIVHPREVFKAAILENAVALILCHNHPSGDANPSPEDIEVTKRLVAGGDILGIKILDHVIIGDNSYVSFADKGLL
ncbi:MAG TPA: JAB domain-containing protein [Candidatus Brocadiaceae bacterium]|nr:JAB domain-containing protein [Candidatus Brocadiaceae bacterium]